MMALSLRSAFERIASLRSIHQYRDLRWNGIQCIHIIMEDCYPVVTSYGYHRPRLCKFKAAYGPGRLLCKRHAKWQREREELLAEFQPRIDAMLANHATPHRHQTSPLRTYPVLQP